MTQVHPTGFVDINEIENMRQLLSMSIGEFALAIGYGSIQGYTAALGEGKIRKVYGLAAECLLHRKTSSEGDRETFDGQVQLIRSSENIRLGNRVIELEEVLKTIKAAVQEVNGELELVL